MGHAAEVCAPDPYAPAMPAVEWPGTCIFGTSGTRHSGGRPRPEWERIDWREGVLVASRMLQHPDVHRAWAVRSAQAMRAQWTVRPAIEGDAEAELYAAHVRASLGLDGEPGMMRTPWAAAMAEAVQFLHFGAYVLEVVWAYDHRAQVWHPVALEGREPLSIDRWGEGDTLGPITQRVSGVGRRPEPMPGRKVLVFTRGRRGTDWTGQGLWRAAYSAWDRLCAVEDALQGGVTRTGVLPPHVEVATPAALQTAQVHDATVRAQLEDLRSALLRYQAGQPSVLVTTPGVVDVRWQTDSYDPARALTLSGYYQGQIAAAYGVELMRLGMTDTGSRSVGEVHASILRGQAVEDVELMAATINGPWRDGGGLVGAMVSVNYPGADLSKLPVVTHTGLEPEALAESLGSLPGLVQSGVLTPDSGAESAVRGVLDLPPLSAEEQRTPAERQAQGSPLVAALARRRAQR